MEASAGLEVGSGGDGAGGTKARIDPDARRRRRRRRRAVWLVVVIVIIIPLLYFFVIPRTELSVKVYYNESMLNQINVATELRNAGTSEASNIDLDVTVVNSTDQGMGSREYSVGTVAPYMGLAKVPSITFRGDQFDRYTIIVDISFSAGGQSHSRHFSHDTQEPWMNQDWTDTVS